MLPSTVDRLPSHTADEIKEQIREQLASRELGI